MYVVLIPSIGKFRHHLHPALLVVWVFEDVFLSGGDELLFWF